MSMLPSILQTIGRNRVAARSIRGRMTELTDMLSRYPALDQFDSDGGLAELAPAEFYDLSEAIDATIEAFHELERCSDELRACEREALL